MKKLTKAQYAARKKETNNLLKKLRYFLYKHPENIIFKRIHGNILGFYDFGIETITLDYRKEIIPTLIHEFIHHLHSTWCETKVLTKERQIMSVLTPRQAHNIIKLLGNCFKNDVEDDN
jgi:hypothetical protein